MDTLEIILWILFILVISLLFFAAFGADKISNQTIEEYMDNLISEEQQRGTQRTMYELWNRYHTPKDMGVLCGFSAKVEDLGMPRV